MARERGGLCVPNLRASACAVVLVLGLGLRSLVAAQCKRGPVVFNFGDSNSDTGGYSAALGANFGLPNGRAFFPEGTGRLGDGRLIIDFLCESLNTSYLSPYLESLGPNFSDGANFAIGGAATLPRYKPFSLDVQVLEFLRFRSRSPLLLSRGYPNLVGEDGFGNALYTIDIGQNDLAGQFDHLPYSQVVQNIPTFIEEIRLAIWGIYKSGGKNFWVHNTGPLGCLPQKLATIAHNASDVDEHGCLKSLNDAARVFNRQLQSLCEELRSQMKNATIVYVDVFAIKYDLIANYAEHGFETSLMVCCGNGGPPYNYNVNIGCGQSGYTVCKEGSRYVSWDGVHYTEAANSFVASRILSANYSTPPVSFNFFCSV
ncbi:GDSL esterase/lipase At1g09390-like isoform X3 [Rhodamnia argentea]|uniref:GDSL esterase/lipase At1g09390-like isoform X3 n=1 Tax=Rhodamnia argentea TaxID=178133 RepID=A0A8B8PD22_9MYRT|nr:GDSL esterase/lipase At1g09390-like isoform X3 [Rhodamnia argentea]